MEIKPTHDLEIDNMKSMIEESIIHGTADIEKRLLKESKINAKIFLNELAGIKKELNELSSKEELVKIKNIMKNLESEIKKNDRNKIQELTKSLDLATQSFSQKRIKKSIQSGLVGKSYDKLL